MSLLCKRSYVLITRQTSVLSLTTSLEARKPQNRSVQCNSLQARSLFLDRPLQLRLSQIAAHTRGAAVAANTTSNRSASLFSVNRTCKYSTDAYAQEEKKDAPQSPPPPPPLSYHPVPPTMFCWGVSGTGGAGSFLELREVATPILSNPQDVLVRVEAASMNPIDVAVIGGYGRTVLGVMQALDCAAAGGGGGWGGGIGSGRGCGGGGGGRGGDGGGVSSGGGGGKHSDRDRLVCGRDFAGVVCGRGRSVRADVRVGQRVMGVVSPHKTGAHAQYVVTHQDNVVPMPVHLDPVSCAGVPYAGLTGYSAAAVSGTGLAGLASLVGLDCGGGAGRRALAGRRVLVTGASGGVGTLLVQMLTNWKAEVAGVCGSDAFQLLESLGVTELYDHSDHNMMETLNSQRSFDLVVDASGGAASRYLGVLRLHSGACLVTLTSPVLTHTDTYGLAPGLVTSACTLVAQNAACATEGRRVTWGYYTPSHTRLAEMAAMMAERQLVCVVDRVFGFEDVPAAYKHMAEGRHRGKTVIDFTEATATASKAARNEPSADAKENSML